MSNTQTATALLSDDDVSQYLLDHPEFFSRNPEILVQMQGPIPIKREDGVVDFQSAMVEKLRDEMQNLTACAQDVIETSRTNMTYLTRTHAAVLAMLSAQDADHMASIITNDLPLLLDVDAVSFGFEQDYKAEAALRLPGVKMLPFHYLDAQMGEGGDISLVRDMLDDGTLFGEDHTLIRSAALARLRPTQTMAGGVIALGSSIPNAFHAGQGTDLLNFLARVSEKLFSKWLGQD
ncbi:MAG: DUF484 family protein [Magnetovibrio sp.]|nr:DUF484 family protein [Magnetovibrio sp.]